MGMTTKKEIKVSAFQFFGQKIFYHALTGLALPNTFQGICVVYASGAADSFFETKMIGNERKWECIGTLKTVLPVWC
jgi:hypothetical protein